LYILNPVTFNVAISGQLNFLIGYALSPLVLALFALSLDNRKALRTRVDKIALTGLLYAFACVQIHFALYLFLLMLGYCIFHARGQFLRSLVVLGASMSSLLLVEAIWLLPLLWGTYLFPIPSVTEQAARLQASNLLNSLRLVGYVTDYFLSSVGPSPLWMLISILVPALCFLSLAPWPRRKDVLYFGVVALSSTFFAKGIAAPFESFSLLLMKAPGGAVLREIYHVTAVTALAYSVLLGFAVEAFLKNRFELAWKVASKLGSKAGKSVILIVLLLITLYSWPLLTGNFDGNLRTYELNPGYKNLNQLLSSQTDDFRVLYLPMMKPFAYGNHTELEGAKYCGIDPVILFSPKASFDQSATFVDPPGKYTAFLHSTMHENRTRLFGRLLGLASVKYIVFREDYESEYRYYHAMAEYPDVWKRYENERGLFWNLLQHQEDIVLEQRGYPISIFRNIDYVPHVYAAESATLVAGDLSSLLTMGNLDGQYRLVYFASQVTDNDAAKLLSSADTFLVLDDDLNDLVFMNLPAEGKIDPGNYALVHSFASDGWSRNWEWYDWDYTAALENSASTEVVDSLTMKFDTALQGLHDVWIKAYFSPRGRAIKINLDGVDLGEIETYSTGERGFRWNRIGQIYMTKGSHSLEIRSIRQSFEAVARIVCAPSSAIQESRNLLQHAIMDKNVELLFEIERLPHDKGFQVSQFGGEASQGYVLRTTNRGRIDTTFTIPTGGSYNVRVRLFPESRGTLTVKIGFTSFVAAVNVSKSFTWLDLGTLSLERGHTSMSIEFFGAANLDLLDIHSLSSQTTEAPVAVSYYVTNPTQYTVRTTSQRPFFLVFSESYSPFWRAYVNGREIPAMLGNAFANTYRIEDTGSLNITIRYIKQIPYSIGMTITATAIIGLVSMVILAPVLAKKRSKLRIIAGRTR